VWVRVPLMTPNFNFYYFTLSSIFINMDNDSNNTNVSPTTVVSGNNNKIDISSIIQDNSGGLSSIRILMLLWGGGVFLIWGFASVMAILHGIYTFPTIPSEVVTTLIGVTGIKTVQRFGEK
jgi:hypothetical protein